MVVLNSLGAGARHAPPRTTNIASALNADRLVPPSFVAAIAALCVAAAPMNGGLIAPALAATGGVPTPQELGKLSEGLAQVD